MAAKVEYCSGLRQVFDWFHLYSTSELFLLCCEVGRYTLGVLWIWNYQSFKVVRSVLMWGLAFWNCTKVRNLFQNDSWIGIGALKIKDCKHLKLKQFGGWERMCSLQQSWEIVAQCWRQSRSRRCCWSRCWRLLSLRRLLSTKCRSPLWSLWWLHKPSGLGLARKLNSPVALWSTLLLVLQCFKQAAPV